MSVIERNPLWLAEALLYLVLLSPSLVCVENGGMYLTEGMLRISVQKRRSHVMYLVMMFSLPSP